LSQSLFFSQKLVIFPTKNWDTFGAKDFFSVKSSDFAIFLGKILQKISYNNIEGKKTQPSMHLYFPQW
jgi:hypothetical protein